MITYLVMIFLCLWRMQKAGDALVQIEQEEQALGA